MPDYNIAAKSKEEQDKIAVDLVASGVAYKERLNMPVVAELVAREQPEYLRAYFMEQLLHYRQLSAQLPDKNAPEYVKKSDDTEKK
ncbi:DNA polymerase III subunit theta [Salmonella enterica]|nr:DNA polymerase III subunit theta [Salmonella enterica]